VPSLLNFSALTRNLSPHRISMNVVPWFELPAPPAVVGLSIVGGLLGIGLHRWAVRETPLTPERSRWNHPALSVLACGALFALTAWGLIVWQSQHTPMVTPSEPGRFWRIPFQLALVGLLWATVITDVRDYVIPDSIVLAGIAIGLGGHFASGELQIQHLWIDWNAEVPGLKGADVPAWIDHWRRLHGLVVGLAGMATGAGITWLVRAVSSKLIGQETMGLGDVTLMAMIGCFLGWQPVLFVFLLAPLCGVTLSLAQRFLGGKTYLPFGPFLALATLIVLLTWKWLWLPLRYVFGHPPSLAILLGGASVGFIVLLILARLYRAIPIHAGNRYSRTEP
jgi:leader peptidase (prepilin peptidase) / N-methyltransferase